MEYEDQLSALLHVVIAAVLGGLIGYERESKNKPAGLRTNMLIAAAAAVMVVLGKHMVVSLDNEFSQNVLNADPIRIIEAIIVGVSFIGAGTIIKSEKTETVKYLTTAATILFSASIGVCVALELYVIAGGITVIGLIINYVIKKLFTSYG